MGWCHGSVTTCSASERFLITQSHFILDEVLRVDKTLTRDHGPVSTPPDVLS